MAVGQDEPSICRRFTPLEDLALSALGWSYSTSTQHRLARFCSPRAPESSQADPTEPPPSRHAQGAGGDRAWRWRRSAARSADGWRHHQSGRRCMTGNHVYGQLYRGFEPEWNHPRSGRFHGGPRCLRSKERPWGAVHRSGIIHEVERNCKGTVAR